MNPTDKPSQPLPPLRDGLIRHGFGLKSEVLDELNADYHSSIVEAIRAQDYRWTEGGLTLRLANAFGFCYGVDKAIDFAYETRRCFPERRIFLTNEIIHNPQVNRRLLEMQIHILAGQYADGMTIDQIQAEDVVILPAFGVDTALLGRLRQIGCVLVDTTCGSVVRVWKRVQKYACDGFTTILHGKWAHEETVATCSHVTSNGGHYLVVRNESEAARICEFIRSGAQADELTEKFRRASSPGFDFHRHLDRVGCANQTTMLSTETLVIAGMFRQAMLDRYGEAELEAHFRSFDTICNATQERQDAIMRMMEQPPNLMLVVGGFNSSNTSHLCEIASLYCPTYHVDDVGCLLSPAEIRHRPPHVNAQPEIAANWLPAHRPLEIGLTAGASTPNKVIGEVIERLIAWEKNAANG